MAEFEAQITAAVRPAPGQAYDFPPSSHCGPHRVFLYKPPGRPPADGWPLLLTTDGNAVFDLAVSTLRIQALDRTGSNVEEGVVAAVGYPTDRLYDQIGRSWDLSPPPGRSYPDVEGREILTGGAHHFLAFLEDVVLPWLTRSVPIDLRRTSLFGHSFGGLFTLFALYRRPALFRTYIAAGPSLFWEEEAIKPFEDRFFSGLPTLPRPTIFLSAGEWEGSELAPYLRGGPDEEELHEKLTYMATVDRAKALLHRFENAPAAGNAFLEVFLGENHMSALPVAVNRAVQAAFAMSEG